MINAGNADRDMTGSSADQDRRSSNWRCRSRSMNGDRQMLLVHTLRIRASCP
jgi:hypothetical protein